MQSLTRVAGCRNRHTLMFNESRSVCIVQHEDPARTTLPSQQVVEPEDSEGLRDPLQDGRKNVGRKTFKKLPHSLPLALEPTAFPHLGLGVHLAARGHVQGAVRNVLMCVAPQSRKHHAQNPQPHRWHVSAEQLA